MVQVSAKNERLNIDEGDMSGPDMGLWDMHRAIFGFLETVPVSSHSAHAAIDLLTALDPEHTSWPGILENVLPRWSNVELKDHKGEDLEGLYTHLTLREELRCLIGALFTRKSTNVKGEPRYFGSPDDDDIALRCAFYAGCDLTEDQLEAGVARDKDVFVLAVLKNRYVFLNKSKRASVESFLSGPFIYLYQRRCEQIHRSHRFFEVRPVSEIGLHLVDEEEKPKPPDKQQQLLERVVRQNEHTLAWLRSFEKRAYWFALLLLVATYFAIKQLLHG